MRENVELRVKDVKGSKKKKKVRKQDVIRILKYSTGKM